MFWMIAAMLTTAGLFRHRVSFPERQKQGEKNFTVIIPARDEEHNLKRLLPTLPDQGEVIVVDDGSTDNTSTIAEQSGAKVIRAPELPEGWMGKSWACHNGAKEASGDMLVFLDADTWLEKGGMEKITGFVEEKQALLTVHPYHVMESFPEKLSAVFHSVVYASTGITKIGRRKTGVQGGFGPCLALPTAMYHQVGGHRTIKGEVTEHLAFSRRAKTLGAPVYAYSGKGVLSMRMYQADMKEVAAGWSKSFASGAASASLRMTVWNAAWISSVVSFLTRMKKTGRASVIGYSFVTGWMYRFWRDIGNFRFWDALIFPIHFLFFISLFVYSVIRTFFLRSSTWKGRVIN